MGLPLMLALAVPVWAADKNQQPQASEQDYNALAQAGQVIGKVKGISPTDKSFTLEIDTNVLLAGNGNRTVMHNLEQQEHFLRLEQDIARTRNLVDRAAKIQRLNAEVERARLQEQARGANPGQTTTVHKSFNLDSTTDAKVRRQDPPAQYDEKGNPKQYTQQELKQLKGDGKLPGYEADWDSLKVGQMVKVTFGKEKKADNANNKDNKDNKNKDKKDDNGPRASLIMIIKDAPENAPAGKNK
jgi:hypothetical protein